MDDVQQPYTGMKLDATAVRVLAHPLRSRLLGQLRLTGPATATELAALLSTNTGATSYHLRKLESVGLVADTGEGEGKRRVWRASTSFHNFHPSDYRDDDDAAAAAGWLQRDYVRRMAERAERWLDVAERWPADWVDAAGVSDTFVTVRADQLRDLQAELNLVLDRWRSAGERDPAACRVQVAWVAHPSDLAADPPGTGRETER
jgi:DNA-binding transcriptional ArsR family regulator